MPCSEASLSLIPQSQYRIFLHILFLSILYIEFHLKLQTCNTQQNRKAFFYYSIDLTNIAPYGIGKTLTKNLYRALNPSTAWAMSYMYVLLKQSHCISSDIFNISSTCYDLIPNIQLRMNTLHVANSVARYSSWYPLPPTNWVKCMIITAAYKWNS